MAKLVIQQSDGVTREVLLNRDRITIGRRPDHDICLPFPAVSADHAEIVTVVADSFLHDLGSTNGTLVNEERVSKHFLKDHDTIDIGRQRLVYLTNEAEHLERERVAPPETAYSVANDPKRDEMVASEPVASVQRVESSESLLAPVDELLTDLMDMDSDATVAVEMPAPVSIVPALPARGVSERAPPSPDRTAPGAYIEVLSGPNAGQITDMTKKEFVLGKRGATIAVIKRDALGYRLTPLDGQRVATLNGQRVESAGARLEFGDTIGVGGVLLRFNSSQSL
jgi:pSer/pThr/pTyr-binding forkhead associated (FHA) protein